MTTDADLRYLESIADDCRAILGPGVEVLELNRSDADPPVLTLRYQLDGWEAVSEVGGETMLEAHARLRTQLVEDRLRLAFSAVADPAPSGTLTGSA
ncbi:MAG TPA: hypothetical protein VEX62_05285 [Candidatus Limnocylindrales bacterium]|nr:hypothetical protein [Candidatus Limnocylindrales bacterium]